MFESGVDGTRKSKKPESKLTNSTQSLERRGFNQLDDEAPWHGDEPMDRIGKELETAGHVGEGI